MRRFLKLLDGLAVGAAVAVAVVFLVQELSEDPVVLLWAERANWLIWLLFLIDFLARMSQTPRRTFWAERETKIDLLVVLLSSPLLELVLRFASEQVLQKLGLIRLARFIPRLLPVASKTARTVRMGASIVFSTRTFKRLFGRRRFHYTFSMAFALVVVFALLVWAAERTSPSERTATSTAAQSADSAQAKGMGLDDAIWWALATSTTIGYGDVSPKGLVGRAIGVCLMFMGIGITSIFTATIASSFMEEFEEEKKEHTVKEWQDLVDQLKRIEDKLDRLETRRP